MLVKVYLSEIFSNSEIKENIESSIPNNIKNDYEEVDTKLASGWYVDSLEGHKKKKYKTKQVSFKISKKSKN